MFERSRFFVFTILFFSLIFSGCDTINRRAPKVHQGRLDLSGWDFEKDGMVALDGTWEFYWMQLHGPLVFKNESPALTGFIAVPGSWSDGSLPGQHLPRTGYGTYRTTVRLSPRVRETNLGLYIPNEASSYKLWINGSQVAVNGTVSSNPDSMLAQFLPIIKNFYVKSDSLEIIMEVANNFHSKGGMWLSPVLGDADQIIKNQSLHFATDLFMAGGYFAFLVYHLLIYLIRRRETAALYFGLTCLMTLLRIVLYGDRLYIYAFPDFDPGLAIRIEYLTVVLYSIFFFSFFYHLFKGDFPVLVRKIIAWLTIPQAILILVAPVRVFTLFLPVFQVFIGVAALVSFVYIIRLWRRKRMFSGAILFSYSILFPALINDLLYSQMIINTAYVAPLVFFLFIVVQAYILAYKISDAHKTSEILSQNLHEANITLEQKVAKRTQELVKAEKLVSLGVLTAGIAHEINNPINFVSGSIPSLKRNFEDVKDLMSAYEKLQLSPEQDIIIAKKRKELDIPTALSESEFLFQGIAEGASRTAQIVKGLTSFSRADTNDKQTGDIIEGIESTLLLLSSRFAEKKITVKKNFHALPLISCFPGELKQLWMNIISNAIEATEENGSISITAAPDQAKKAIVISIKDSGKGMSEEIMKKIFDPFFTTKEVGKGTGLGLSISYGIVEKHEGKIEAKSETGQGSEFIITLPV